MHLRPKLVVLTLGLAALAATAADGRAWAQLTDEELVCQRGTINATEAYLSATMNARQACFQGTLDGSLPSTLDCLAPAAATTGDDATDTKLRRAESDLSQTLAAKCTGVVLENLGFPGFCADADGPPFTVLDHELCILEKSNKTMNTLLQTEYGAATSTLTASELSCQADVASKPAAMFLREFRDRTACLLRQFSGTISSAVDCRAEETRDSPNTGDAQTDSEVVSDHSVVLAGLSSSCSGIQLDHLGFPNLCPSPPAVFSLQQLVTCMFFTHHGSSFRLTDLVSPSGSPCGDGVRDSGEACDDGDRSFTRGEACQSDCSATLCGDPDGNGLRNIVDALMILRSSIGVFPCVLSVCDLNHDGQVSTTDALRSLQFSVGNPVTLDCPALL